MMVQNLPYHILCLHLFSQCIHIFGSWSKRKPEVLILDLWQRDPPPMEPEVGQLQGQLDKAVWVDLPALDGRLAKGCESVAEHLDVTGLWAHSGPVVRRWGLGHGDPAHAQRQMPRLTDSR